MTGRLRRLWRDLIGRSDDVFVDLLEQQVTVALRAATVLLDAQCEQDSLAPRTKEEVQRLEEQGDEHRRSLLAELARALTTPIDREDLFRLSQAVDNVIDNLRDFTVEMERYGAKPQERFAGPLEALAKGLDELRQAIGELRDGVDVVAGAARAGQYANKARDAFHDAMSELLSEDDEVTMQTLRDRELLRRLDVTGLRLSTAAEALSSGALKRG